MRRSVAVIIENKDPALAAKGATTTVPIVFASFLPRVQLRKRAARQSERGSVPKEPQTTIKVDPDRDCLVCRESIEGNKCTRSH
jgi:hypothetical protein